MWPGEHTNCFRGRGQGYAGGIYFPVARRYKRRVEINTLGERS
jgi:hypothetical protein